MKKGGPKAALVVESVDQNLAFAVSMNVRPRPVSIVLPAIVLDAGV